MTRIRLSLRAAAFIRSETAYLRNRNPAAARDFAASMRHASRLLQSFPEAGNRMHHGLQIAGSRTLVVGDYLLVYLYNGESVDIVAALHGRMAYQVPDPNDDAEP